MTSNPPAPSARRSLAEFIHDELTGGVVLLVATNLAAGSYEHVWSTVVGPSSPLHLNLELHAWVNDALMAVFFFVVGLEIKRELVVGELARPRDAAMPVIAAVGGMAVPALIYALLNTGGSGRDGWAIPMATDIAFVLGALALLGSRAPAGLRLFLLAVAIVDDLGAIVVIAIFFSDGINLAELAGAGGVLLGVVGMRRIGITHPAAYIAPAVALWLLVHESGVHATLAGVALGLLTPARPVNGRPLLDELQHRLHPISALIVVPLFALANAGMVVRIDTLRDAARSPIAWGIVSGLVLGKTVGIACASLLALRLGIGQLPAGVGTAQLVGGAALAGIGFTVALFIADLTFAGTASLAESKLAVLAASITAASIGSIILTRTSRPETHGQRAAPETAAE
jgi:Na+:H+ antiporter, NhaA family